MTKTQQTANHRFRANTCPFILHRDLITGSQILGDNTSGGPIAASRDGAQQRIEAMSLNEAGVAASSFPRFSEPSTDKTASTAGAPLVRPPDSRAIMSPAATSIGLAAPSTTAEALPAPKFASDNAEDPMRCVTH